MPTDEFPMHQDTARLRDMEVAALRTALRIAHAKLVVVAAALTAMREDGLHKSADFIQRAMDEAGACAERESRR